MFPVKTYRLQQAVGKDLIISCWPILCKLHKYVYFTKEVNFLKNEITKFAEEDTKVKRMTFYCREKNVDPFFPTQNTFVSKIKRRSSVEEGESGGGVSKMMLR